MSLAAGIRVPFVPESKEEYQEATVSVAVLNVSFMEPTKFNEIPFKCTASRNNPNYELNALQQQSAAVISTQNTQSCGPRMMTLAKRTRELV